jgi:hypothetical protein
MADASSSTPAILEEQPTNPLETKDESPVQVPWWKSLPYIKITLRLLLIATAIAALVFQSNGVITVVSDITVYLNKLTYILRVVSFVTLFFSIFMLLVYMIASYKPQMNLEHIGILFWLFLLVDLVLLLVWAAELLVIVALNGIVSCNGTVNVSFITVKAYDWCALYSQSVVVSILALVWLLALIVERRALKRPA